MSISGSGAIISVKVYPNAGRNEVVGLRDETLRVKIAASPVRGKTNKELLAFLSHLLGVGKDSLSIIRGYTSRNKVVAIDGLSRKEVLGWLLPGYSCS